MNSSYLRLVALAVFALVGCDQPSVQRAASQQAKADLPEISAFLTKPSDRFLVDLNEITGGHPFKGAASPSPHAGAHVHCDNTGSRYPYGNDKPRNYPAI